MTATAVALTGASAQGAEAKLPLGKADGVRIHRQHGALVVTFGPRAARLYRRVAGRFISVLCTEMSHEDGLGFQSVDSGGITLRAPKRRRPIRTGDLTRGMDYCRVWLAARTIRRRGGRERHGRELIVSVPLTQRGAVHLDEEKKVATLAAVLTYASLVGEEKRSQDWPEPAELVEAVRKITRGRLELVGLASPADTPAPGAVGYYSDGRRHTAVVILSASGRRLYIELDADEVLRTNVAKHIFPAFV